ncbi:MAG: hypothetical protein LUE61_03735 [Clostridiales bacterium]|nr:hypothetical protein [Clostridiales bacterium]
MSVSSTAVAFFGVYYKLQSFLMMPLNGLGQAVIPIVGYNYGAKDGGRIREVWNIIIPAGVIFSLAATVIFLLLPRQLLGLFSASEEMLAIGVPALRIISATFVCAAVTMLCGYFASGLGNGVINMVGGALRQLVLLVPLVYLFTLWFGISHTWYAMWIAELAAMVYSAVSVRREIRRKVDPLPDKAKAE